MINDFRKLIKRKPRRFLSFVLACCAVFSGTIYAGGTLGEDPVSTDTVAYRSEGTASYYATRFQGRRTSSGERLDNNGYMAAHPSLPFGTVVRVTNKKNGKSVLVQVEDRFRPSGRHLIDITRRAAKDLDMMHEGIAFVYLEVIRPELARQLFLPDTVTWLLSGPPVLCPLKAPDCTVVALPLPVPGSVEPR